VLCFCNKLHNRREKIKKCAKACIETKEKEEDKDSPHFVGISQPILPMPFGAIAFVVPSLSPIWTICSSKVPSLLCDVHLLAIPMLSLVLVLPQVALGVLPFPAYFWFSIS
jgi:hypothetical protein